MGHSERKILDEVDRRPDVWWRYIDDMFIIWSHVKEYLTEFTNQINNKHPKIQFTAKWSNRSVAFLDIKTIIGKEDIIMDLLQNLWL